MLELYDMSLRKTAILNNVISISEDRQINQLFTLSFSMPGDDPKNALCRPFHYVRFKTRLYRILPTALDISETETNTYECEHVIATLIDKMMYGSVVIGNIGIYTADVIRFVLAKQSDWKLGRCDFGHQFEYGWEHESLYSALFSIPKEFTDTFIWTYNTANYPWTVNLERLDTEKPPELYIRKDKNLLSVTKQSDPRNLCTRLYALGYGEGVNALSFKDINNGLPYLQSPASYVEKYGIKERIWVDRRYENKESLLAAAKVTLEELQEPFIEYSVGFTDVDETFQNKSELGKTCLIVAEGIKVKTYIVGASYTYTDTVECTLSIANKPKDIATSIADMADRQRIEMTYAQGATQIYGQSVQANSDTKAGTVINFYIPEELRIINRVKAKIQLSAFRAYSKATEGGGSTTQTSSSGGGSSQTSSSGGGGAPTSSAGGGSDSTTRSGGSTSTTSGQSGGSTTLEDTSAPSSESPSRHLHNFWLVKHEHTVRTPSHEHDFRIPEHTHNISVPEHTHNVNIPSHTHDLSLPNHVHSITPGIYTFGNPSAFRLYVNGIQRALFNTTSEEIDITNYLLDEKNLIPRGVWQKVEVIANDLSYITIDISVQGFIQSRGDTTV